MQTEIKFVNTLEITTTKTLKSVGKAIAIQCINEVKNHLSNIEQSGKDPIGKTSIRIDKNLEIDITTSGVS